MINPRREKIKELKEVIKTASKELAEANKEFKSKAGNNVWDDATRLEKMKALSQLKAVVEELALELENTRRNKSGSSVAKFIPSGPNRRQRRAMARKVHV